MRGGQLFGEGAGKNRGQFINSKIGVSFINKSIGLMSRERSADKWAGVACKQDDNITIYCATGRMGAEEEGYHWSKAFAPPCMTSPRASVDSVLPASSITTNLGMPDTWNFSLSSLMCLSPKGTATQGMS